MIVWFLAAALASDCPDPVPSTVLEDRLDRAESAFYDLDPQGFHREVDKAAFELPCVGDPIPPALAARYHGVIGVRQLILRERERAVRSLAAARGADPDLRFGAGFLPEGHIAFELYDETEAPADLIEVPEPASGVLLFDGTARLTRSPSHPTIVQILDGEGGVVLTDYVRPGDPLPSYPVSGPTREPRDTDGRRRVGWFVASAGSALVSVVLYGVSADQAARFAEPDPSVSLQALERRQRITNGLVIGSGVAGATAVGTLAAGMFSRR